MKTPRQILTGVEGSNPVFRAPAEVRKPSAEGTAERVIVPQPIHSHSVYRRLMESHDRMHTRHIKG